MSKMQVIAFQGQESGLKVTLSHMNFVPVGVDAASTKDCDFTNPTSSPLRK